MPSNTLVMRRKIEENVSGDPYIIDAHITRHDDEGKGITWIKLYHANFPENYSHCYVDTMNPELILDAMENYVRAGKFAEVENFLQQDGRALGNPVTFRLKLDSALGGGSLANEVTDLF